MSGPDGPHRKRINYKELDSQLHIIGIIWTSEVSRQHKLVATITICFLFVKHYTNTEYDTDQNWVLNVLL